MSASSQSPCLGRGTWLSLGSPVVAELASECGFDWVLLDMEHGMLTEGGLFANLQAVKRDNLKAIVRVGSADPVLISRALDWGAAGIMLPHVSQVRQAIVCIEYMRYPPHGKRGFTSGARAFRYGLTSGELPPPLFIAQIEDYEGVMNAADIAGVAGVDVLFVGPADLRLDLSTRQGKERLEFDYALRMVVEACKGKKAQTGILAKDSGDALRLKDAGFQNIAIGSDLRFVREGFRAAMGDR